MMKFNLLALTFVAATALSAQAAMPQFDITPVDKSGAYAHILEDGGINPLKIKTVDAQTAAEFNELYRSAKARKAKAVTAVDATNWTALSGCRIKDPLMTIYGSLLPEIYSADVRQDPSDPTHYAVVDPMAKSGFVGAGLSLGQKKYFNSTGNTMEIFAADDERVYAYPVKVASVNAIYQSTIGKTIEIANIAGLYISNPDYGKDSNRDHYGYIEDDVITFPAYSMMVYVDGSVAGIYVDDYSVALPDGKLYATAVTADKVCTYEDEEQVQLTIYMDGDLSNVSFGVYPMYCEPGESQYKEFVDYVSTTMTTGGTTFFTPYSIITQICAMLGDEIVHSPYTVFALGLDDNGKYLANSGSLLQFFHQPDESQYYKTVGTGKFTDDFFATVYGFTGERTADVEIQESIYDPGYIRIVNPMKDIYPDNIDGTHDHFIYMNVYETESYPICIEFSSCGWVLSSASFPCMVCSHSYYSLFSNAYGSESFATWDEATNTITFPQGTLFFGEPGSMKGTLYDTNNGGKFALKLPDGYTKSAVRSVIADGNSDAPVEYFNLQGVRITNPQPGQLVIRRQGTTATKQLFR